MGRPPAVRRIGRLVGPPPVLPTGHLFVRPPQEDSVLALLVVLVDDRPVGAGVGEAVIGYSDPGHDYFNNPPHEPPAFLDGQGKRIFAQIEANLVEQCKRDRQGNGAVIFRKERLEAVIDAVVDISQLVRSIQEILDGEQQ